MTGGKWPEGSTVKLSERRAYPGLYTRLHIVLAPLDPACRLAEHPIESLEIVLNEIKVTGEITDF